MPIGDETAPPTAAVNGSPPATAVATARAIAMSSDWPARPARMEQQTERQRPVVPGEGLARQAVDRRRIEEL
jgi:hypothetical protein